MFEDLSFGLVSALVGTASVITYDSNYISKEINQKRNETI